MTIDNRDVAEHHLRTHYNDTRTMEGQPSIVAPIPADVFRQPSGFMFAVTFLSGERHIIRVGPRGSIAVHMAFTEYAWTWLKTEWRY